VNRVNDNKKESRWVIISSKLAISLRVCYPVDQGLWLYLLGISVFGNANQVFVKFLSRLEVFRYAFIILAKSTTKCEILEQTEDELVGVLFNP